MTEPIEAVSATEEPEMRAEEGGGQDVDERQPAADEADEDLGEIDEALRHARLRP